MVSFGLEFEVHKEPLYRRYYAAAPFSQSFAFTFIVGFLSIFLSLFIAYNSHDFWLKETIVYDQPHLFYRHQAIVELYGRSSTTGAPMSLYFSSSATLNSMHGDNFRSAVLQSRTADDNLDGIPERLEVSIKMPLKNTEEITGMSVALFHDVSINSYAKFMFDSASLISFEAGRSAISSVKVDGDLMIKQSNTLHESNTYSVPYATPLLAKNIPSSGFSEEKASLNYLMAAAAQRELSSQFKPTYHVATHTMEPPTADLSPNSFNATIVMRVPYQPIRVQPTVQQVLKLGWMQFLAFFLVVTFLMFRMLSYVFKHKLLDANSMDDVVVEKMD
jgi:hypothetical protein